jgi:2'-5' RNA ligase
MAEQSIRSFIAASIAPAVRDAVAQLAASFAAGDVRWSPPEQYHLTLKFLGNASSNQLARVAIQLREITKNRSHFMVELDRIGAFPRFDRPRVIWVGVGAGTDQLIELARLVEMACTPVGFPREGRPYHPHLALGRVRSSRSIDSLVSRLQSAGSLDIQPFAVEEVLLMESRLQRDGAVHLVRERFPLGSTAAATEQESSGASAT